MALSEATVADSALQLPEMRQDVRRKVNLAARVLIDDTSHMNCVVRNLSSKGALIAVTHTKYLPDEIGLVIPVLKFDGKVRIVWRRTHSIGVAF
jgi:hypothetical protein